MRRCAALARAALAVAPLALWACGAPAQRADAPAPAKPPLPGLEAADELIQPGEQHFARLWRVTRGGESAEGYWSFGGERLVLQRRAGEAHCDRIFVTAADGSGLRQVSSGRGTTTCAYFLPDERSVLFASTQAHQADCPPPPDLSEGYVWVLRPEFDLWVHELESGAERRLTETWGYDAEATVSPRGDRMVFTSMRTGDPELWTANLDGTGLEQVTFSPGYDGGAFFSHDGRTLVYRRTVFAPDGQPGDWAQYSELIAESKVRPHRLELMLADADGSNPRRLTDLGGASFAPTFFPDDRRVIFASNFHEESARNFDLFAVTVDGERLERITFYEGFDAFPHFSPDGRWLAFASNRGGSEPGETSLFVAEWR